MGTPKACPGCNKDIPRCREKRLPQRVYKKTQRRLVLPRKISNNLDLYHGKMCIKNYMR